MNVRVQHYALFREAAGCSGETVALDRGDAIALFDLVKAKYNLEICRSHVRLAVNDAFVDWSAPLSEGDSIVFIPPVAGG